MLFETEIVSMGLCKKDVTALLTHWGYIFFFQLTHRYYFYVVYQVEWTVGTEVVALYEFDGNDPEDLAFNCGDILTITSTTVKGLTL